MSEAGSFFVCNYDVGCGLLLSLNDDLVMQLVAELDAETFVHCQRVQAPALVLGEKMGLPSSELKHLGLGAFLHDVGKKYLPAGILKKQAPLTREEWEAIKTHPLLGYECAKSLGMEEAVSRIVLEHHLWADGQGGYPQELQGRKPTLLTQIVTVADVVDAMTSHRSYRRALSMSACLAYLEEYAGTQFNQDIVDIFMSTVRLDVAVSR